MNLREGYVALVEFGATAVEGAHRGTEQLGAEVGSQLQPGLDSEGFQVSLGDRGRE
jgi:hypothetical protein